ncbi:MAG: hypothetical protein LQ338_005655 [Usnochroma carphineum]|nr:MAG: hypothetical protein LQ338_005655 [Usnochroma carphineum]
MAVEANATLVDEYDLLMQDLEPFWGMSAKELRSRTAMVSTSDVWISQMTVRDNKMEITHNGHPTRRNEVLQIKDWMQPFAEFLPNMDLVFNGIDEPRVIVPHATLESSLRTCPKRTGSDHASTSIPSGAPLPPFEFLNNDKQSIWDLATISCPPNSPASNTRYSPPPQPSTLGFVRNVSLVKDTCQNPGPSMQHGFVVAPETLRTTTELVPIWSQSKLGSFQDLIMPSPAYKPNPGYNATLDPPWSSKLMQLYWVGSTTGGNNHDYNWRYMHRERLVDLVNSPNRKITLLNQTLPGGRWMPFHTTLSHVRNLFNVAFTRTVQCEEEACEALRKDYPFHSQNSPDDAFKYRFVFDMDGNAWSGRYYTLLRSKSTVLKQGVFREFGDQWIQPWVHYVPISMDAAELPEVMRFLSQTAEGQMIAERIAEEGREWAGRALREVDLQLAAGRAILEWGRLMDPTRDETGECGPGRTRYGGMRRIRTLRPFSESQRR